MRPPPGLSPADARRFRRRSAALLPLGVLAVHQARYALGYGDHAGRALAEQGHAYLPWAVPLAVILAACAGAEALLRVVGTWGARATRRGAEPARHRALLVWGGTALLLFVLYCGQESLEGLLSSGHPDGLAGILGHAGWTSAPLALVVAAALGLGLRLPAALEDWVAAWPAPRAPLPRRVAATTRHAWVDSPPAWRLTPLAGGAAGRAPPAGAPQPS